MYRRDRDDEIIAYADAERLKTRTVKTKFAKKRKSAPPSLLPEQHGPQRTGQKKLSLEQN